MKNSTVFNRKLVSKTGLEVYFSDFGAAITAIKVPVSEGGKTDVVLGFDTLEEYQKSFELPSQPFLGATVGLHAGRVKNGMYKDGDHTVQLEQNNGANHLHGGSETLSKRFWNLASESDNTLVYELDANHGKTKVTATYTVENDSIHACLQAETQENVLINLTQHSYFNLEGHTGDVTHLEMKINAHQILETSSDLIATGKFVAVEKSGYDFRDFHACPAEIDTSFVLDNGNPAAVLRNPRNGLSMEVSTNQPSVHVFVGGAHCNPIKGKGNTVYHTTSGICFEAQNFPDSPNHPDFKNGILKPGETYTNDITFTFKHK